MKLSELTNDELGEWDNERSRLEEIFLPQDVDLITSMAISNSTVHNAYHVSVRDNGTRMLGKAQTLKIVNAFRAGFSDALYQET